VDELLTERTVLGAMVLVGVVALVVLVALRRRKADASIADAVLDVIRRLSKTAPELRNGLTKQAAEQFTKQLVHVLNCVAIGITDSSGELLSWDGAAKEHYRDFADAIDLALRNGQREHINHLNLHCDQRGRCPMRTAVIVPLILEGGDFEGVLIVVGGLDSKRLIRAADEVAKFLLIQLEMARLEESKQQLAQAQVRMLRAQISPHFLYNALNSISSLINTDPEHARTLLHDFADFTRYSFRTSGHFTTLADELRNIDRYFTIQSQRFQERLNVRIKIAPEVLPVVMPFLVLQPLVENAIQHGISPKPDGGTITVVAQDNGTEAVISVEDDGVGMDADRLMADLREAYVAGTHVGIGNINHRMKQVFGEEYALMVETAPGAGMKVVLRVPKYFPGVLPNLPDFTNPDEDTVEPDAVPPANGEVRQQAR
jgi:two-component system LytT family sensor kinase